MADAVDAFLAIPDLFGVERPVRQKVVKALAEAVDESFGDDAADLAQKLRESGAVDTLARLLDDQVPGISNRAMMMLGNLVGEFFDPEACQSLDLLLQAGGMERVLAHLERPFPSNLYAAACLQNMTAHDEGCFALQHDDRAVPKLQAMLQADNADVAKFAAGCLANMRSKGVGLGAGNELEEVLDQRWRQEVLDTIRASIAARSLQAGWRAYTSAKRAAPEEQGAPAAAAEFEALEQLMRRISPGQLDEYIAGAREQGEALVRRPVENGRAPD